MVHAMTVDYILPFHVENLDIRGRGANFTTLIDEVLEHHTDYPEPVQRVLAECIAFAAMFSSNLKSEGRVIMQVQTTGPIRLCVVDVTLPDKIRALARFDDERVAKAIKSGYISTSALMGRGHLAITMDLGKSLDRYQGVVAIAGQGLERAADQYFNQSEQIPTKMRLVAKKTDGKWLARGFFIQHLPKMAVQKDMDGGDGSEVIEDNHWAEAKALVSTVEDEEMILADVTPEKLAFRLFHESDLRIYPKMSFKAQCTCSRDRLQALVSQFSHEEKADLAIEGKVTVDCDFCGRKYEFKAEEVN
jgi:molecular chaperone Hsp33